MTRTAAPEMLERWATVPSQDTTTEGSRILLHASAIALDGQGVLVLGPSGAGKSSLALSLMAHGATLIADDGVWATAADRTIMITRPGNAAPLIEARGIGLLPAGPTISIAPLMVAVDLTRTEPDRLPPQRIITLGAAQARLILGADSPMLTPALLHLIRHHSPDH